jgi:outer membrane protein assembly factor BamB
MTHRLPLPASAVSAVPLLALAFFSAQILEAADWPQFLGPTRDGRYVGHAIRTELPKDGIEPVWSIKVGSGFSGPVVAGENVVLFHRVEDEEIVEALDRDTGQSVWRSPTPTRYRDDFGFDNGPRATPAINGGRIYTMGALGGVRCHELKTGKEVWSLDAGARFGASKGFFGMACSPIVVGDVVVIILGGDANAGIIALDKTTGDLAWKTGADEAGYASPTVAYGSIDNDRPRLFCLDRERFLVLDPKTGRELVKRPFRASMHASVNAATPIVRGDRVLLSASYGAGAVLLDLAGSRPKVVWENDDAISSHYNTPVESGGYVYGVHGRADVPPKPSLRCVEFAAGLVRWQRPNFGSASLIDAGKMLVALVETGELVLIEKTSQRYIEHGRMQILGSDTRSAPAFADGRFYARDPRRLVCVNLRASTAAAP